MAPRPDRNAERLTQNLRRSVNAARGLSFALSGVSGQLGGAVNLAATLAENIAKVSKNARIAASATGIGAVVAVLGTAVAFATGWASKTKEIARDVASIRRETEILNARGAGDERLAKELEIVDAMERELQAAKEQESVFRKFPELQEAVREKAAASMRAANAETARAFGDRLFDLNEGPTLTGKGTDAMRERARRTFEIAKDRDAALRDAGRQGFNDEQMGEVRQAIQARFEQQMAELAFDMDAPIRSMGDQLGVSFADSLADGIVAGLQSGNVEEGFRALTGGMLIGLGNLMQQIGTQSLLAARLLDSIVTALSSFAPAGAIGPVLALIAAGGVVKALGASMGGRNRGRGGSSGAGAGYGSSGVGTIIDRGIINPLNPLPGAGSIQAKQPVTLQATFFGTDDARAQRDFLVWMDKSIARRAG